MLSFSNPTDQISDMRVVSGQIPHMELPIGQIQHRVSTQSWHIGETMHQWGLICRAMSCGSWGSPRVQKFGGRWTEAAIIASALEEIDAPPLLNFWTHGELYRLDDSSTGQIWPSVLSHRKLHISKLFHFSAKLPLESSKASLWCFVLTTAHWSNPFLLKNGHITVCRLICTG